METIIILILFLIIPLFYYRVIKELEWIEIKKQLIPKYKGIKKEIIGSIQLFGTLITGFILIAITIGIIEHLFQTPINDMGNVAEFVTSGFTISPIIFIITIIIIVFIEEFFFRAFLVKKIGIILSTIIFTFFHLGYESITQTIGVFFLGLILAYWYKKNNSLFQNYFGHLIYNCLAISLYLL
jgi:membrane protease YdiL (CAAX protease family)